VAITGTSHLWRWSLPRLRRVQVAFLPAVVPGPGWDDADPVSELIDDRVWPAVVDEYGRLRAKPGLIAAGLAATGIGGGILAKRQLDVRRKPRLARQGRAPQSPVPPGRRGLIRRLRSRR
jgi:hypothetical protein